MTITQLFNSVAARSRTAGWAIALIVLTLGPAHAQSTSGTSPPKASPAQEARPKTIGQPTQPKLVPSLIVLNARGATLQGQTLTLAGVSPNSIVFADRPVRSAGHDLTAHIIEDWGGGNDSFAKNPPNATVSVFDKAGTTVKDAVVVLKSPNLAGNTLSFDVDVLEGDIAGADGAASIFIDIIRMPRTPMSYAGVARRTAYRAAWNAGAANDYYHSYYYPPRPPCGYYPYPPCY
jgi:hypothetical protein